MHSFLDAKTMAKSLRAALAERHIDITHSDSLEFVARQFGFENWNILSAKIEAAKADFPNLPPGWFRTGSSNASLHWSGPDPKRPGTLLIESVAAAGDIGGQFASLAHTILADEYRGRLVRFSADLMGEGCTMAAIWMRIDAEHGEHSLRFDNLATHQRGGQLSGTFDWTERTIILDVPDGAYRIVYGMSSSASVASGRGASM